MLLNEPKLIFDCGFENEMTRREIENTAKQLMLCFGLNRDHRIPFDLNFCNLDPKVN